MSVKRFRTYDIMEYDVKKHSKNFVNTPLPPQFKLVEITRENADIFNTPENDFWNTKEMLSSLQPGKGKVYGVLDGDKPVAFGAILYKGANGRYFRIKKSDAYVGGLFTFPAYRSKGLMRQFLNDILKGLETGSKVTLCVLPNNAPAVHCYRKFGFKKTKTYTVMSVYKYALPYHKI